MQKNTRYIVVICITAVITVLLLQFYWIKNYYKVNRFTFEKEVNMAFEDALKKEFSLRCDTIQQLIANKLMDTTEYKITSEFDRKRNHYVQTIANAHDLHDKYLSSSFYNKKLNKALLPGDTLFKKAIAESFAQVMRSEDLDNHVVYYRTQNIGKYAIDNVEKYNFDTARLRPVLLHYLAERKIKVPFKFYLREADSTFNRSRFPPQLTRQYPIITKAYPTYKQNSNQQYVRVLFTDPFTYIIAQMGLMLAGSVFLIGVVGFSLFYLLRTLYREKKLSAIKNDFISNITHEFKTPIATVSAAVEALTSFDVLDDREKTQRYLHHSKNELNRLASLVDKVLNISLYENQQFNIRPEQLNIDEIINTILNESSLISTKTVKFTYQNNSGLATIYADKLYFQHTILNVIDNAIKYSDKQADIQVECMLRPGHFLIAVKDKGPGISNAHLPYIFEKFYRVPSKQHHIKGHGLGLSYVKSIIEKHHGWCKMESELGKGSTLYLAWPL
ncbi:MAG: HAMP domain-containing sensor histidine kinase [Bacteroidota bacterium]